MASNTEDGAQSEVRSLDFDSVPVIALNVSSRLVLSKNLNPEQELTGSNGLPRDYRGMAQLMDFDYVDLRNFERHANPVKRILETWEMNEGSTIGKLIQILEEIGRHDVIDDVLPLFQGDAERYKKKQEQKRKEPPLQVQEVTESTASQFFPVDSPNQLTLDDGYGYLTYYDAYVCYADEDVEFVLKLAEYLENLPELPIKLCIRGRDIPLGSPLYDTFVNLMEKRCNRMMIVLSPEFLNCHDCEFQARFATGLAVEQRRRMLIPIVYKPCETPPLLKFVSKVDFTKPDIQEWVWRKLIMSIKSPSETFLPPQPFPQRLPPPISVPSLCPAFENSTSAGAASRQLTQTIVLSLPPSTSAITTHTLSTTSSSALHTSHLAPVSPSSKLRRWFREKLGTNSSTSSSSLASSGFHSLTSSQSSSGHSSPASVPLPTSSTVPEPSRPSRNRSASQQVDTATEADSQTNSLHPESDEEMEHSL